MVLLGSGPEISWVEGDLGRPDLTVITGPSPGPQGMLRAGAARRLGVAFDEVVAAPAGR